MYNGTTRILAVNKNVLCVSCQGRGTLCAMIESFDICYGCNGVGFQLALRKTSNTTEEFVQRECDSCWGEGKLIAAKQRCSKCEGRKVVAEECILIVKVKRGTRHGQKIIYKNEGTQEPNMRPGDLIVIMEALDHQTFKRQGDDLIMSMPLELVESLCGFEKVVTTLDKRKLCIRSRCGEVMQNNEIKCLYGEGMPKYANPSERGRLIIQFHVNLPDRIRSRFVASLEECLPPREHVEIPLAAVECNMIDLPLDYETYNSAYDPNDGDYIPDQTYDQQYEMHENGMHQYGADGQCDNQGIYYQNDEYAIPENYVHAGDHEQQYYYSQQVYDPHTSTFQQEQFCQKDNDCESLESYDNTQLQYRFGD
ncbi:hypothetical protein HA402_002527 [Bradysia odoriphaga]|nr:hypothetical protein HA402_002527 [Bradysia odoriphaga]